MQIVGIKRVISEMLTMATKANKVVRQTNMGVNLLHLHVQVYKTRTAF